MKKFKEVMKPMAKWIIGICAVCILIYLVAANLGSVSDAFNAITGLFTPLIVGFLIALILNVPMRFF